MAFCVTMFIPNLVKIRKLVQQLKWETDAHTDKLLSQA
jgi:hypothetical protein